MKKSSIILNGIFKENPIFVLFLGMCPILATTKTIFSAIGMSVCVLLVLLATNTIISLLSRVTPDEIRIPVYIIIIATVVSVVDMLVKAFAPGLYAEIETFIKLIVVNCIILGRAESFASKNNVLDSVKDALGNALGFFLAAFVIAFIREIIGTGSLSMKDLNGNLLFSLPILPEGYNISLFNEASGAFLVLGICVALFSVIKDSVEKKNAAKAKAAKN